MSEKAPANLVERLRALHVWPQMVADTYADVLPPRHAKGLYEVGDVAHQAADALSAKDAEIARLREALQGARATVLDLMNSRGSEAEGSDEEWVSDIDAALQPTSWGEADV